MTVNSLNDTPVTIADTTTTPQNNPVTKNVLTNDSDVDSIASLNTTINALHNLNPAVNITS